MSGTFFGFGCVETARNAARFSGWFFLGFGVFLFGKVLLFLGVVRRGFLSDPVPHGRFWRNVLGSAVFWGFLMVVCQMSWSLLGFCSELRSSSLRCSSELPSGIRPRDFFSDKPGFFGHL